MYFLFVLLLQGDEGGPLTTLNSPRRLVGIVSWKWDCGSSIWPAVYTKVSAVQEWITDICSSQIVDKGIIKADAMP